MELQQSLLQDTEQTTRHKTKKRKHADSEQAASSKKKKKRKHLDQSPEDATDTPTHISKSRPKAQQSNALSSNPSSPPVPATLADSDHDISITDAPSLTNGPPSPATTLSSPFNTTTLSLYLPLPAIALSPTTALPSLLTTHLAPLLLTYYPPLRGIVLSITNPILSSKKPQPDNPPPHPPPPPLPSTEDYASSRTVLAHCADTDGLSYIWLTATFLTFQPKIGDELEGWVNVCSEGFVGLICYNYFQVAVARNRIPGNWRWVVPGGEGNGSARKGKGKARKTTTKAKKKMDGDEEGEETATSQGTLVNGIDGGRVVEEAENQEEENEEQGSGYFRRENGSRVKGSIRFKVVDCEIVPGPDRESWSLQIEGTLLGAEEERRVLEDEREKALRRCGKALMNGGLRFGTSSRNGS